MTPRLPDRSFLATPRPELSRGELSSVDDVTVKSTRDTIFVLTTGAGEVVYPVSFTVLFAERPALTFGGSLDDNEFVEARKMPTVSAVVVRWVKALTDRVGGGLNDPGWFSGAEVAIVTTGKVEQHMWVNLVFEGKAVRPPLGSAGDLDESL